jgi:hypothetical protein
MGLRIGESDEAIIAALTEGLFEETSDPAALDTANVAVLSQMLGVALLRCARLEEAPSE